MTYPQAPGQPDADLPGPGTTAVLWLGLVALSVPLVGVVAFLSMVVGVVAPSTSPLWVVGTPALVAGVPDDDPSAPSSDPTPFPEAGPPVDPDVVPDGTDAAPLPVGRPGTVGAWHVTIDHAVDATASLLADGAGDPVHGRYVLLQVTGMYQGDGQGDPAQDLVAGVRDGDGADWYAADCGAVPDDPLQDAGPVLGGQWFTAQVCVDLPPTGDEGALLFLQTSGSAPGTDGAARTYYR